MSYLGPIPPEVVAWIEGLITGIVGAPGPPGADGDPGVDGDPGAPGADGRTILSGTAAPTTEGADGDFYLRTTTSMLYGPKAAGVWPAGTSLIGPTGPAGAGTTVLVDTTVPVGGQPTLSASGLAASGFFKFRATIYGLVESTSIDRENVSLRFNGDTGSNYTTSGGAAATSITIGELPASITNANRAGYIEFTFTSLQGWWTEVYGIGSTVRDTATVSRENRTFDAWSGSVSAALDSLSLVATTDFSAGTRFVLEGLL